MCHFVALVCVRLMKKITNGFLICVEGVDGSGKSLFAKALNQELITNGYSTLLTREPGGTTLGERIRELLFDKQTSPCHKAEFLLFAASRAQHCHNLIAPALAQGSIVISDRMADSSLVYQGYVRGLSLDLIHSVNVWAMSDLKPTVIFYLKVDARTAFNRINQRAIERCDFEDSLAPLEKAIIGFDTIFAGNKTVITLDATQIPEKVLAQGIEALQALL